ncbi:S49 family peptidase, partial [Emcibacteraceae bacterium Y4]
IYEARGRKPVIAYASGDAASGAYWIAAAADEIVVSKTSALGSIGVVGVYQGGKDTDTVEVVSSQSPFKRLDPGSDEGRARLQKRIDAMAGVFVDAVAK